MFLRSSKSKKGVNLGSDNPMKGSTARENLKFICLSSEWLMRTFVHIC